MKRKATDILGFMVLIALVIFCGTGALIVVKEIASEGVRWFFDIRSAPLFLLVFFWLLAQEEFSNRAIEESRKEVWGRTQIRTGIKAVLGPVARIGDNEEGLH
jgi:hypothetical protein